MYGVQRLRWIFLFFVILILFFIADTNWNIRYREEDDIPPLKTILLWNSFFSVKDYYFGLEEKPFIDYGCKQSKCSLKLRDKKNINDLFTYDAILFHGAEYDYDKNNFPKDRQQNQIYIYLNMESPQNRPVKSNLNDIFNLTITPRIDSDVQLPYFYFYDLAGNIISPSIEPNWVAAENRTNNLTKYLEIHKRKKKASAWFSSNCHTKSKRELLIADLQKFISVDVYGRCGPFKCSRSKEDICFNKIREDYFFYLSYENSLCDDYITEKAANPYRYESVPIIYSGANLSRYLPPDSYIDAKQFKPSELAEKMKFLMENPEEYIKYFWWKDFYKPTFDSVYSVPSFCKLCEKLHNPNMQNNIYENIVNWWHGTEKHPICT